MLSTKEQLTEMFQDKSYTELAERLHWLFKNIDESVELYQRDLEFIDEEIEVLITLLSNYVE